MAQSTYIEQYLPTMNMDIAKDPELSQLQKDYPDGPPLRHFEQYFSVINDFTIAMADLSEHNTATNVTSIGPNERDGIKLATLLAAHSRERDEYNVHSKCHDTVLERECDNKRAELALQHHLEQTELQRCDQGMISSAVCAHKMSQGYLLDAYTYETMSLAQVLRETLHDVDERYATRMHLTIARPKDAPDGRLMLEWSQALQKVRGNAKCERAAIDVAYAAEETRLREQWTVQEDELEQEMQEHWDELMDRQEEDRATKEKEIGGVWAMRHWVRNLVLDRIRDRQRKEVDDLAPGWREV